MLQFINALRDLSDEQARQFVANETDVMGRRWVDLLALKRQEPTFEPLAQTIAEAAARGRVVHDARSREQYFAALEQHHQQQAAYATQVRADLVKRAGKNGNLHAARLEWIAELEQQLALLRGISV